MLDYNRYCNEALFIFDDYKLNTGQTQHVCMLILSLFVFLAPGGVAIARSIPAVIVTQPCLSFTISCQTLVRRNTFRVCILGSRRRHNCTLDSGRYCNEALFMLDDYMSNTGQTQHVRMVILSLLVFLAPGGGATARLGSNRYCDEPLFMLDDYMSNTGQTQHVWMLILSLFLFLAPGFVVLGIGPLRAFVGEDLIPQTL
jgi:hypothetical protein